MEAVYERWLVRAKFESRSTSRYLAIIYVSDYFNVRRQKRVIGNQP